jgi:hypothetical protein
VLRFELPEHLGEHAFIILYPLCLVQNQKLKVQLFQLVLLHYYRLERCQNYVVTPVVPQLGAQLISLFMVPVEIKNLNGRTPLMYFPPPLAQSDFGHNDQMVGCSVGNLFLGLQLFNQSQDSNGLDGLAQAHLISKDTVQVSLI